LFSRRNGGFPPNLEILEEGRYIRKLYKDPMTPDGEFQPVYFGQPLPGETPEAGRGGPPASAVTLGQAGELTGAGPIIGVVSTSTEKSLRLYNGRGHYNEWAFVAVEAIAQPGAPGGAQNPGGLPTDSGVPGFRGGGAGREGFGRGAPGQDGGRAPNGGGAQRGFPFLGR